MISLLVAYTKNKRVIGAQGKIPWKLSSERNRFKEICKNKYVIMGRKSFEEIGKPLPYCTLVIISHERIFKNLKTCPSLDAAIDFCKAQGQEEILRHAGILPQLNPQKPLQAARRASNIHHRMQHRRVANHQRPIGDGQQKERRHHRQQRHDRVTACKSPEASKGLQCASVQITSSRRKRQMRTCAAGRLRQMPLRGMQTGRHTSSAPQTN